MGLIDLLNPIVELDHSLNFFPAIQGDQNKFLHSNNRNCSHMHFCYICLQVNDGISVMENLLPYKRLADGSKRVLRFLIFSVHR
jgi:hypothetical protein